MRFHHRPVVAVLAFGALCAGSAAYAGTAGAPQSRVSLPGTVPAWAQAADLTGTPAPGTRVTINVGLALRSAAAAAALALDVSDPTSKNYGHYLTPSQFNARYAPAAATVASVRNFLTASGLAVDERVPRRLAPAYAGRGGLTDRWFADHVRSRLVAPDVVRL